MCLAAGTTSICPKAGHPIIYGEPKPILLHGRDQRRYDVYYFVNRIKRGTGTGKGECATDQDAIGMRAYAADFDKGLPETWHQEPSIVVRTSKVFEAEKE